MILFFDTETTGLPKRYDARITELDNWPRIVQLAWIVTSDDGIIKTENDLIIYPSGFHIPEDASKIHGITTEKAIRDGIQIEHALEKFNVDAKYCDLFVAHNVDFDKKIVGSEIVRANMPSYLYKPKICTMKSSTSLCQLPNPNGYGGYKWPKLEELYKHLFEKDMENAHNALYDIQVCVECFFELKRRGVIECTN